MTQGADREVRFREAPVPALPPGLNVPPEGIERIFGHGVARSIVTRRLEHAVGDAVRSTLESYASVLRRWALENLNDIRVAWASTTDALRAHLDRELGHNQDGSVGTNDVEDDLRRLQVPDGRDDAFRAPTSIVNV